MRFILGVIPALIALFIIFLGIPYIAYCGDWWKDAFTTPDESEDTKE